MSLLEIKNLTTSFATEQGKVQAVRGISLSVEQGEIVGIVGESARQEPVDVLGDGSPE